VWCNSEENNHLNSPLQVIFFFARFPADAVRCRCSNVVQSLSLCNKFIMHNSTNVKKRQWACSTHLNLIFDFLAKEKMRSCRQTVAWFWGFLYTHIIIHDYLWKEFWLSFKPLLKALTCAVMTLFLLLSQQVGHKLAAIWLMFRLTLKMLWTDPKWTSEHVSNFMYSDSSLYEDKFLHSINIFVCFAPLWMFHVYGIFNRSHTAFELLKPVKTCVLPLVWSLNLFSTFQVFTAFCPV